MKRLITILCLLPLLCGCTAEERVGGDDYSGPRQLVRFTLAGLEPATRAAGATTPLAPGTTLTVAAYNPTTKVFITQSHYKVNAAGTNLELNASSDMFLSPGTYDFCAFSPSRVLAGDGRTLTINEAGADILASTTRGTMRTTATTLTLNNLSHRSSLLHFTARMVKPAADMDTVMSFKIVQVTLDSMVTATPNNYLFPDNNYTLPDLTQSANRRELIVDGLRFRYQKNPPEVAPPTTPPSYKSGSHYNIQNDSLVVYPKAANSFLVTVKVAITNKSGVEREFNIKARINRLAFEPGKLYLFEINYGWDFVNFEVKVKSWYIRDNDQDGVGSGEQEVGTILQVIEGWTEISLGGDIG